MKKRPNSSLSRKLVVFLVVLVGALGSSTSAALASVSSGPYSSNHSDQVTYTPINISRPSSVSVGDLMLANITINGGTNAVVSAVPTGWTQITRTDNDTNLALVSYYKIADASDTSTSTYQWQISGQTNAEGAIIPYSGIDTSNPIDTSVGNTGYGTLASTTPVTTTASNDRIVSLFGIDVGNSSYANAYFSTSTTPIGMQKKYDLSSTPFGPSIASMEVAQSSIGSSGSATTTISGGRARNWAAQTIALKSAATMIQFDASSSNYTNTPGSSITTSHTISTSTNRMLFVSVTTFNSAGNGDVVTGVTYNGSAMTQVGKTAVYTHPDHGIENYLYYLVAPASGTHDIVVSYPTLSGIVWIANASYTGVSQSGLDASTTSSFNQFGTEATGTITTLADNDWVVMGSYSGDGNTSAGSGTTIRATSPTLDRQVLSDSGGPKTPAGDVTLTVNNNYDRVGSVTAAITPAN